MYYLKGPTTLWIHQRGRRTIRILLQHTNRERSYSGQVRFPSTPRVTIHRHSCQVYPWYVPISCIAADSANERSLRGVDPAKWVVEDLLNDPLISKYLGGEQSFSASGSANFQKQVGLFSRQSVLA